MNDMKGELDSHLAIETHDGLDDASALNHLAQLIDGSLDCNRLDGIEKAIRLGDELTKRRLIPKHATLLNYFLSNAWASYSRISHANTANVWQWEQPEVEKQIIHLRRAFRSQGFQELHPIRQCQILTNLGNLLNTVGRFVEALDYWNQALTIVPAFGMAIGNRGQGLIHYARELYDEGHQPIFLRHAHAELVAALSTDCADPSGVDSYARQGFEENRQWIESRLPADFLEKEKQLDEFPLGDSDDEIKYRRWCLERRLFLNPLNDLGVHSIAAHDVLMTPSMIDDGKTGPGFVGFYNQMKQEFVSARFLFYEGLTSTEPHYADKGVLLSNTLDYPTHCLAIEMVKAGFRMAYSLLDKAAYFLNHYLNLGIPERQVGLRSFWYEKQNRAKGLRAEFDRRENWPLRGLFWLSKDLFENSVDFKDCLEPDAQELDVIRNHAEHKYLKIHDMLVSGTNVAKGDSQYDHLRDSLAYSIRRTEFEAKALRLLSISRASLIYLSLAVHVEERQKRRTQSKDTLLFPIHLGTLDDSWKS